VGGAVDAARRTDSNQLTYSLFEVDGVELSLDEEEPLLSEDEVLEALAGLSVVDFVSDDLLSPSPALIAARIDLEA
jgi:hypothetical protein